MTPFFALSPKIQPENHVITKITPQTHSRAAYSAYKLSGIESLREIPRHWKVVRLKRITKFGYGGSLSAEDRVDGLTPVYGSNGVVGIHNRPNTKSPCLVIGRKGSFGKVTYSEQPCFAIDTTYYVDMTQTVHDLRWLYYCLKWLKLDSFSKDSAVPGLAREDAYENFLPYCFPTEQRAIAAFLDRETARVGALIEKKQRQVELLQEKRTALISRAVTKGLDPNARMKDSGIEWLGEIPEGWQKLRVKHIASINDEVLSEATAPDYELLYVDIGSVEAIYGIQKKEQMRFENAPSRARRRVRDGDVIVSTVRTYLRAIAPVVEPESNLIVSTGFAVVRPRQRLENIFAAYVLRAPYFVDTVVSRSVGVSYPAVNASDIADIHLAVPPSSEQHAIAAFLDRETARIDALIEKVEASIDLLSEYRTALISAAVTGKIDVRKEAA